jgi:hypothetical protein
MYWKIGWPMVAVGAVLWFFEAFLPGTQFFMGLGAIVFLGAGAASVGIGVFSAHSEGVEKNEKERRIRDRSKTLRCLYLEGNVPDGKGTVGRCRLYEFDMVDMPYCLYCREYTASKGTPRV